MCSGRETRSLATERGHKGSKTHYTLRYESDNDFIGDDYSVAVGMMESDDVLRGR